ncbi:MAG TPA: hypothetical protein V6D29_01530 [Leptolyngbyaceae cyanobacterium]
MAITDPRQEIEQVHRLLTQYFDLGVCEVSAVVESWLQHFELLWVHNAVIEALYQGRYKLVSVEQILWFWQRRGQPLRHFSREFESIIYGETLLFSNLPVLKEGGQSEPRSLPYSSENSAFIESQHRQFPSVDTEVLNSTPTEEPVSRLANPFIPKARLEGDDPKQGVSSEEAPACPVEESLDSPQSSEEGLSIEPFKPTAQPVIKPGLRIHPSPDTRQSRFTGHSEPIQTFVPETHPSDFDERLQAVARQSLAPL